mgnify:CR=1 FL=1
MTFHHVKALQPLTDLASAHRNPRQTNQREGVGIVPRATATTPNLIIREAMTFPIP